jgi:hypothetical protein
MLYFRFELDREWNHDPIFDPVRRLYRGTRIELNNCNPKSQTHDSTPAAPNPDGLPEHRNASFKRMYRNLHIKRLNSLLEDLEMCYVKAFYSRSTLESQSTTIVRGTLCTPRHILTLQAQESAPPKRPSRLSNVRKQK